MSYTMTMDMPSKASDYVMKCGPRFQSQLRSLVIAFVMAEMQSAGFEHDDGVADAPARTGASFARAWGRIGVVDGELDLSRRAEHLREIDFA